MPIKSPLALAIEFSVLRLLLLDIHDGFPQLSEIRDHGGHPPQLAVDRRLGALDDHFYLILLGGPGLDFQELTPPAVHVLLEILFWFLLNILQITE